MKPITWMQALRDSPQRPPASQLTVLVMLALRMRKDGTGWAFHQQLADDAGVSRWTVQRALDWAMKTMVLERTQRGRRVKDGVSTPSHYRLLQCSSSATLGTDPNVAEADPNVAETHPNVAPVQHNRVLLSTESSHHQRTADDDAPSRENFPTQPRPRCIEDWWQWMRSNGSRIDPGQPLEQRYQRALQAIIDKVGLVTEPGREMQVAALADYLEDVTGSRPRREDTSKLHRQVRTHGPKETLSALDKASVRADGDTPGALIAYAGSVLDNAVHDNGQPTPEKLMGIQL